MPTASARAATRGRGAAALITELHCVLATVLVFLLQNLFDVSAGFGELDVLDGEVGPSPLVGVAGSGVVSGQGRRLIPVVAFEVFPQEERPVTDVDFRISE